jgi:hypothetical protein
MLLGDVARLFIRGVPMWRHDIKASMSEERQLYCAYMPRISFKGRAIVGVGDGEWC